MHPIFIQLGPITIYWYGIMAAAGFIAAVLNWSFIARREQRSAGFASDLAVWLMLGGIIGARLAYVVSHHAEFLQAPLTIIRIDQGGLIYYGGLIGGILAAILFAKRHKLPLWDLGDFAMTAVPLSHALGRIGCFLNGCCYGSTCQLPWAVHMEHALRHPTQLYETVLNLAIYGTLLYTYFHRKRSGAVVITYLLLYPVVRFMMEFLRGDPRMHTAGLTVAQLISIGLWIFGLVLFLALPRKTPASPTTINA